MEIKPELLITIPFPPSKVIEVVPEIVKLFVNVVIVPLTNIASSFDVIVPVLVRVVNTLVAERWIAPKVLSDAELLIVPELVRLNIVLPASNKIVEDAPLNDDVIVPELLSVVLFPEFLTAVAVDIVIDPGVVTIKSSLSARVTNEVVAVLIVASAANNCWALVSKKK